MGGAQLIVGEIAGLRKAWVKRVVSQRMAWVLKSSSAGNSRTESLGTTKGCAARKTEVTMNRPTPVVMSSHW